MNMPCAVSFVSLAVLEKLYSSDVARFEVLKKLFFFLKERQELHLLSAIPCLNGRVLDLVGLYQQVVKRGGVLQVSRLQKWEEVANVLNLSHVKTLSLLGYYIRYLQAFEMKNMFGKDAPLNTMPNIPMAPYPSANMMPPQVALPASAAAPAVPVPTYKNTVDNTTPLSEDFYNKEISHYFEDDQEIATAMDIQAAENPRLTPLPEGGKQIRISRLHLSDLNGLHRLVLALDCGIEAQVSWALNQLTLLSYGSEYSSSNDLFIENIPSLLDALYRQLEDAHLLWFLDSQSQMASCKNHLFNLSSKTSKRILLDNRGFVVLNVIRNLAMIPQNEFQIASHQQMLVLMTNLLLSPNEKIANYALDIFSFISKEIGVKKDSIDDSSYAFSSKDNFDPVSLIRQIFEVVSSSKFLQCNTRDKVHRSCEVIKLLAQNNNSLAIFSTKSNSLNLIEIICRRLVELLYIPMQGQGGNFNLLSTADSNEIEEEDSDWPNSWQNDNLMIHQRRVGADMGVIFGPKDGIQSDYPLMDENLDFATRDISLQALYYLSDLKSDFMKLEIARQTSCLQKLSAVLVSRVGEAESSRIAVGVLSNLSMNPETFKYFLPIEKTMVLLASSDTRLSDILSNVIADVFGMHTL